MMKTLHKWLAAVCLALPLVSNATVLQFNTSLSAANELSTTSSNALASGLATLFYDTSNNTFSLSLTASGLSSAVTGAHIHALASTTQNGPVRIALDTGPFVMFNPVGSGTLLLGGSGVAAPALIPAGNSFAAQSFLSALQNGLAYINVHTANNLGGEIRGQLSQVAVVPELEISTLMFAGLGLMGFIAIRRRKS